MPQHVNIATKGKPFWAKVLVVIANLTTHWKCEKCKSVYPHHPWKGHRIGESKTRAGTCEFCEARAAQDRRFEREMHVLRNTSMMERNIASDAAFDREFHQ